MCFSSFRLLQSPLPLSVSSSEFNSYDDEYNHAGTNAKPIHHLAFRILQEHESGRSYPIEELLRSYSSGTGVLHISPRRIKSFCIVERECTFIS